MGLSQYLCFRIMLVEEGLGASIPSRNAHPRTLAGRGWAVTLHMPTWWHLVHDNIHTDIQSRADKFPPAHSTALPSIHNPVVTILLCSVLSISSGLNYPLPRCAAAMKPPLTFPIRRNHWSISHCPCLFVL